MKSRVTRVAAGIAVLATLALPTTVFAADPASPPSAVTSWQVQVATMRTEATLGTHVTTCIEEHGSMAGLFGPQGAMVADAREVSR